MEENKNLSEELEQMRGQFNSLKEKLSKQEIVTDHLMRQAMKTKMSWVEKYFKIELYVLLPFVILWCIPIVFVFEITWWWYVYTVIMMTLEVGTDYYVNLYKAANFDANLLEASRILAWQKKMRIRQLFFGIPLLIVWVLWLGAGIMALDTTGNGFTEGMKHGGIIGGSVGLFVGAIIGVHHLLKMQRINTELIKQINEMTEQ